MKIVKESLGDQGFFRSDDPMKNLQIGVQEATKATLLKSGIGKDEIGEVINTIQKITRKWSYTSRTNIDQIYFNKTLSIALDEEFGDDYRSSRKDPIHNIETRNFFKDIITQTAKNGDEIEEHDLLLYWAEFMRSILKDPTLFHDIWNNLLDKCDSNRDNE